jgi:hypothetical protein
VRFFFNSPDLDGEIIVSARLVLHLPNRCRQTLGVSGNFIRKFFLEKTVDNPNKGLYNPQLSTARCQDKTAMPNGVMVARLTLDQLV